MDILFVNRCLAVFVVGVVTVRSIVESWKCFDRIARKRTQLLSKLNGILSIITAAGAGDYGGRNIWTKLRSATCSWNAVNDDSVSGGGNPSDVISAKLQMKTKTTPAAGKADGSSTWRSRGLRAARMLDSTTSSSLCGCLIAWLAIVHLTLARLTAGETRTIHIEQAGVYCYIVASILFCMAMKP